MEKRKKSSKSKSNKRLKADEFDPSPYLKLKQDPRPLLYTTKPIQPKEKKPGQLTEKQLNSFFENGFVVVEDYFDTALLDAAREAINKLVDDLANILLKAKKIKNTYKDKGFFDRLTFIDKEYPGTAVVLHKLGVLPQEFRDIWSNENLLNAVEQLIGPEIAAHPVWNLRTKTPKNEQTTVPWHQDNAYLEPCSLDALQPTAWIPLLDATKKTGCMVLASGGHKKGITATHTCCAGETWYVDLPEEVIQKELDVDMKKDLVVCEVPYGGVLFLNNAVPHKSLENFSDKIRWSLDLRWQKPDLPNGYHGRAPNVLMRTKKNPNHKIDWSPFETPRLEQWEKEISGNSDLLNPIVTGPWMRRWKITHHNKHTAALTATSNFALANKA